MASLLLASSRPPPSLAEELNSDLRKGLNDLEADRLLSLDGPNKLKVSSHRQKGKKYKKYEVYRIVTKICEKTIICES